MRDGEERDEERRRQERHQYQPIEQDVAEQDGDQGPGVRGEQSQSRSEVVAVLSEMGDLLRFRNLRVCAANASRSWAWDRRWLQ